MASAGITFSNQEPLFFSEYYLNNSIDREISTLTNSYVDRSQIVEIGSLASDNPKGAKIMISLIPLICWLMGKKYIICTTTITLRKILRKLKIPFTGIKEANVNCIPSKSHETWGSYYQNNPMVGFIEIEKCEELFKNTCGSFSIPELLNSYDKKLVQGER